MSIPLVRRRRADGTLGNFEPMFPSDELKSDNDKLAMAQALIGQQEQISQQNALIAKLQEEINKLKGGE